jgi:hypothetical protein
VQTKKRHWSWSGCLDDMACELAGESKLVETARIGSVRVRNWIVEKSRRTIEGYFQAPTGELT